MEESLSRLKLSSLLVSCEVFWRGRAAGKGGLVVTRWLPELLADSLLVNEDGPDPVELSSFVEVEANDCTGGELVLVLLLLLTTSRQFTRGS